ncbi:unnamed protein product [Sphagnum balticum]
MQQIQQRHQRQQRRTATAMSRLFQQNAASECFRRPRGATNLRYPETISNWESRKLRETLQSQTGTADGNEGSHRGLKAHVGGAVGKLGLVVGTVANAYVPSRRCSANKRRAENRDCPRALPGSF